MRRAFIAALLVLGLARQGTAQGSEQEQTPEQAPVAEPEPEVAEPEVAEPEVAEPEVAEPEVAEPEVAEPEVAEPEVAEPEVAEPEVAEPEREPQPVVEAPPSPADEAVGRASAVEGTYDFRLLSRDFTYNDDFYGFLREHEQPLGAEFGIRLRWYPGAHFTDGVGAAFGVEFGIEQSFPMTSERADGQEFDTVNRAIDVGLRGRLPLGDHELSAVVGYGSHRFRFQPAGPSQPGVDVLPDVPSVLYRFLRYGVEARFVLAQRLALRASGAYLTVFSTGGLESELWFPKTDAAGVELGGSIGWQVTSGYELFVGVDLRRYFMDMNVDVGDPWIAGGALDQFVTYRVGATVQY